MPLGLTKAPATFQVLMNKIFAVHLIKFVLVFFDDISIYSKIMEDHISHLQQVLQLPRSNSLSAKRSKCTFSASQVEYLGHVISATGVATDPRKIEAIQTWPIPMFITQLRSFLGVTGYYRRFIRDYDPICRSLHNLKKRLFSLDKRAYKFISRAQE
jgi:hypothetical protein